MENPDESPYALASRLWTERVAPGEIEKALARRGLAPDEVFTVLAAVARQQGDAETELLARRAASAVGSPGDSPDEVRDREDRVRNMNLVTGVGFVAIGLTILFVSKGSVIAYGLTLAGIARAAASLIRRRPLPPQVPLAAEDPSQRCAWHPQFKSVGTCPRCGSFCCRDCAPPKGLSAGRVCLHCVGSQAYRDEKLRTAARRVALSFIVPAAVSVGAVAAAAFGLLPEGLALGLAVHNLGWVAAAACFAAPFAALGVLQALVRHPWPALLALCVAAGQFMFLMNYTDGNVDSSMAAPLSALVCAFLLPEHWTRYTEARAPAPGAASAPGVP